MQFIALLLFFSLTCFAKSDFCSFSSDFSEKYLEARKVYADRIKEKRKDPTSKTSSGAFRTREFKKNWASVSMKSVVNKLFKTSDIEVKVKANGKMLIYPKRVKEGGPVIVFDPSGDYFRIAKATINKAGMVKDENSYFDVRGNPVAFPKDKTLMDGYAKQTHFHATP